MPEKRMVSVTVRLPPVVHAAFKEGATYNGLSLSAFMRESTMMRLVWQHLVRASAFSADETSEQYVNQAVQKAVAIEWERMFGSDRP